MSQVRILKYCVRKEIRMSKQTKTEQVYEWLPRSELGTVNIDYANKILTQAWGSPEQLIQKGYDKRKSEEEALVYAIQKEHTKAKQLIFDKGIAKGKAEAVELSEYEWDNLELLINRSDKVNPDLVDSILYGVTKQLLKNREARNERYSEV